MNAAIRYARATKHAKDRARERLGVELAYEHWEAIVKHARDGAYVEAVGKSTCPDGSTKAFYVPMGSSEADAVVVPMVINLDRGIVVTVLDPEPI